MSKHSTETAKARAWLEGHHTITTVALIALRAALLQLDLGSASETDVSDALLAAQVAEALTIVG